MPGMKGREFEGAFVRLSAASRVLAAEAARFSAPESVELALLREMANLHRLRRRRIVYSVAGGAMAAALAFAAWTAYRPVPPLSLVMTAPAVTHVPQSVTVAAEPAVVKHRRHAAKPAPTPQEPFIAIPYTLPLEPYERADVMRMDVPVAALIAAGLPMNMADPAALALADVLVGQDGRARAIRLVASSN
jgi:hypothetical protein